MTVCRILHYKMMSTSLLFTEPASKDKTSLLLVESVLASLRLFPHLDLGVAAPAPVKPVQPARPPLT